MKLAEDFQIASINMFKGLKENINTMRKQVENLSRDCKL